jgi:3-deoxy-manno-octulosonate cytidylyltransferase (CMP-KDO synthetase)
VCNTNVGQRATIATQCVNLVHRITSQREFIDPNTIKVVADLNGNALYFSRSPIPHGNFEETTKAFKQVCVIPFTRRCLQEFSRLPSTPLERAESIDMLRLLEHGRSVRLVETLTATHSVDTPADLQFVQTMMKDDQLMRQYA